MDAWFYFESYSCTSLYTLFKVRDLVSAQFDSQYNTHGGFKQYLKNKATKLCFQELLSQICA